MTPTRTKVKSNGKTYVVVHDRDGVIGIEAKDAAVRAGL